MIENKALLDFLTESGLLGIDQSERLVRESETTRQRVEDIIHEKRLVDDIEVAKIKSKILNIPYTKVDLTGLTEDLLKLIPEETSSNYKVAPLSKNKDMLVVGMVNPDDIKAQEALRFIAKQNKISLGIYLITPSDLELVLKKYSPFGSQIQAAVKSLNIKPGQGIAGIKKVRFEESAVTEDAPIIKIVSSTFKEAVGAGASDIHVEPQRDRLRIRFRIDGVLQEVSSLPLELHQPIVSRIKILSNLKIDENRIPQDGRFRTVLFGRDIDYRVSTFPTPSGEKVALRVLDPQIGLKKLDELGLVDHNADVVKKALEKPFGMILITGPTGSGKTTTLYALLQGLNNDEYNIVSLEDPVEYTIDGINQSQVRPEIGYDFASGLRQILRQDPDVIMVGEIRDSETASLAVHAALTGHIVLSTLHTNNAIGVIPRLIDMKVDAFLFPSSLNVMLAQRLLGKLCQSCKKAEDPSSEINELIKKEIGKIKSQTSYKIYHAVGCKECKNKGIKGRIAIFEALEMTPKLMEGNIAEEAKKQGMVTMRQDGLLKAIEGLVSVEEVLRETSEA
mgnify:CR=1 FL=1